MRDSIDTIIKSVMNEEADGISFQNRFDIIKREMLKKQSSRFTYKTVQFKVSVTAICSLIAVFTILIVSSSIRSFAQEVINNVKTLFLVEKSGDGYVAAEKPADEVYVKWSQDDDNTAHMTKENLLEKLSFEFNYEEELDDFKLHQKSMEVIFGKETAYYSGYPLLEEIKKAVLSDEALNRLKDHGAYRKINLLYKNNEGSDILILGEPIIKDYDIQRIPEEQSGIEFNKVTIGDYDGYWYKTIGVLYPDGRDMSKKPTGTKNLFYLTWQSDKAQYTVILDENSAISKEDAINFASSFQEVQP